MVGTRQHCCKVKVSAVYTVQWNPQCSGVVGIVCTWSVQKHWRTRGYNEKRGACSSKSTGMHLGAYNAQGMYQYFIIPPPRPYSEIGPNHLPKHSLSPHCAPGYMARYSVQLKAHAVRSMPTGGGGGMPSTPSSSPAPAFRPCMAVGWSKVVRTGCTGRGS